MKRKRLIVLLLLILFICTALVYTPGLQLDPTGKEQDLPEPQEGNGGIRMKASPFYQESSGLPQIEAPVNFDWRRFEGVTLNFIVENNINANILTKESQAFTEATGINVNIRPMDFNTWIEKTNIDFISQTGKYHLVYVDPYQTLNRFTKNLEDLTRYNIDPDLPHIPGGLEDFYEEQVNVDAYFIDKEAFYTVPFDTTTMILYYRKDIFDKYGERFKQDNGYDWTPGQKGFTWERYSEIADWIDRNVPDSEVKYGSGHMAQKHNSIFCDFSSILAAYGGDYFEDENVGSLGIDKPQSISVMEPAFIHALDMYKKIIKTASPQSLNWDWYDTAEAFKKGDIAMMPNWDENSSSFENPNTSKVAGKVGHSILPYGPVRSANIFGGSGIGINRHADEREKQAAWLFIVWATSPQTQLFILKHPEGGGIPPRKSVYEDEDIKNVLSGKVLGSKSYANILQLPAVLEAWKKENAYYRPKIGNFYDVEQIIIRNLHEMLRNDIGAQDTASSIYDQLKALDGQ